jgi:hypothetical protein
MLMNRFINRFLRRFYRHPSEQPFQTNPQICLFNKRPVLHRDFTQVSLRDAIIELQTRLQAQGYYVTPRGDFDAETEHAVREFQKDNLIFIDGVVGPLTWACLCYPKLSRHQPKNPSPEIATALEELKNILREEKYAIQDQPTCFGRDTERAIKAVQRKYGLKIDGVVGAVTWAVLLGMRQEVPQAFFRLPPQSLLFFDQFLKVCFVVLGMHFNPFLTEEPPSLSYAIATAYVLTLLVPVVADRFPGSISDSYPSLLRYAPYVSTGMFWQPLFKSIGILFGEIMEKIV